RLKGEPDQARQSASEALAIADRCEYRLEQAEIQLFLAQLAFEQGQMPLAQGHAQAARERAACDGPPFCYARVLEQSEALLKRISGAPAHLYVPKRDVHETKTKWGLTRRRRAM